MKLNRTLRIGFALLLALMLPLQGYAALSNCGQRDQANSGSHANAGHHAKPSADATPAAHSTPSANATPRADATPGADSPIASPPAHQHCTGGSSAIHHHDCGNGCCGAAIALTAIHWIAPQASAPEISNAILRSPPSVTLDRLDRPPRLLSV